jgi:hypothetical protein
MQHPNLPKLQKILSGFSHFPVILWPSKKWYHTMPVSGIFQLRHSTFSRLYQ